MNDLQKRSWAEISLPNIRHNYEAIRAALPEGCRFLGVVKADAYGHGALPVSRLLQKAGADYLAVSCLDEALELRRGGITMPILILGHTPPEYTGMLIEEDLTQTVSALAKAKEYSAAARELGKTLRVHIKLDTGMSRLGFLCAGDYFDIGVGNVIASCHLPNLEPEGIYTHFAVSDEEGEENEAYTRQQFKLFTDVIAAAKERGGVEFAIRHCANSGAVVHYPEMALDMVRPGLLLYGYGDESGRLGLRPCMRLVTTVSTIKHYEAGRRAAPHPLQPLQLLCGRRLRPPAGQHLHGHVHGGSDGAAPGGGGQRGGDLRRAQRHQCPGAGGRHHLLRAAVRGVQAGAAGVSNVGATLAVARSV